MAIKILKNTQLQSGQWVYAPDVVYGLSNAQEQALIQGGDAVASDASQLPGLPVMTAADIAARNAAGVSGLPAARLTLENVNKVDALVAGAWKSVSLGVIGDSKSAQGVSGGASGYRHLARSYWPMAVGMTGGALRVVAVSAVGGRKIADAVAAFDAEVKPYSPGTLLIWIGVNDLYQLPAARTSTDKAWADLMELYAKAESIGAQVVRVGIPPSGTSQGAAVYTPSTIALVRAFNARDRAYCLSKGWEFVDPWDASFAGDPLSATAHAPAGTYYDSIIHDSHAGAFRAAKSVSAALNRLLINRPRIEPFAKSLADTITATRVTLTSIVGNGTMATATLAGHNFAAGDEVTIWSSTAAENASDYYGVKTISSADATAGTFSYACTATAATAGTLYASASRQLCDNPLMQGTAGTLTVATGTVVTGCSLTATAGMTVLASIEAHTKWAAAPGSTAAADQDGLGNWQRIDCTSVAAGDTVTLEYVIPQAFAMRGGQSYYAEVEVEVYGTIANVRGVSLAQQIYWTSTGSFEAGIDMRDCWDASSNEANGATAYKTVLRIPLWTDYLRSVTGIDRATMYPAGKFGQSGQQKVQLVAEFAGAGGCSIRAGLLSVVRG